MYSCTNWIAHLGDATISLQRHLYWNLYPLVAIPNISCPDTSISIRPLTSLVQACLRRSMTSTNKSAVVPRRRCHFLVSNGLRTTHQVLCGSACWNSKSRDICCSSGKQMAWQYEFRWYETTCWCKAISTIEYEDLLHLPNFNDNRLTNISYMYC